MNVYESHFKAHKTRAPNNWKPAVGTQHNGRMDGLEFELN